MKKFLFLAAAVIVVFSEAQSQNLQASLTTGFTTGNSVRIKVRSKDAATSGGLIMYSELCFTNTFINYTQTDSICCCRAITVNCSRYLHSH